MIVARLVRSLADLALPTACAGCGEPGERVCAGCRAGAVASTWAAGPRPVAPRPAPAGFPPTHAAAAYDGPLARWVVAFKDADRRDLRRELAPLLARSVEAALADGPRARAVLRDRAGPVLLVPVPSARAAVRHRGDRPLLILAGDVAAGYRRDEVALAPLLRVVRQVRDQSGLGAAERADNLRGAMDVAPRRRAAVVGACCVLVDDVVTSGATLVEAARALAGAGAVEVVGATVCATRRRAVLRGYW